MRSRARLICKCKRSGHAYYRRRCATCGLATNFSPRRLWREEHWRADLQHTPRQGDRSRADQIAQLLQSTTTQLVELTTPARFRDWTVQQQLASREYRSWRYRAGEWQARQNHDVVQEHGAICARVVGLQEYANRRLRRAIEAVYRRELPRLLAQNFDCWTNPWETLVLETNPSRSCRSPWMGWRARRTHDDLSP